MDGEQEVDDGLHFGHDLRELASISRSASSQLFFLINFGIVINNDYGVLYRTL